MTPLVSIITPFHNAAPYLAEAIESVRRQSHENWELLLIDDASSDGGPAIAAVAAAGDGRIRLLRTSGPRPRGAAAARNLGLRAAKGSFVAFLDADDLFADDKLRIEIAALTRHPEAAMVYGRTRWWHPGAPERDWTEPVAREAGRVHVPPSLLARILLLQKGQVPCTCAVLIRREAADAVGGFEEDFRLYEDQTLWAKIFARFPVYVSGACVARYRQHPESASALASRAGQYDRIQPHSSRTAFLAWVADYVAQHRLEHAGLARALRLARARYDAPAGLQRTLDRLLLGILDTVRGARARAQAHGRRVLGLILGGL